MNATQLNTTGRPDSSDDHYRKRLMIDELIEQLIRRRIDETFEPGDADQDKVIRMRRKPTQDPQFQALNRIDA